MQCKAETALSPTTFLRVLVGSISTQEDQGVVALHFPCMHPVIEAFCCIIGESNMRPPIKRSPLYVETKL